MTDSKLKNLRLDRFIFQEQDRLKNQVYLENKIKKIKRIKASRSNIHGGELVQTGGKGVLNSSTISQDFLWMGEDLTKPSPFWKDMPSLP